MMHSGCMGHTLRCYMFIKYCSMQLIIVTLIDRDYKELNKKSEAARLAWEASMHRCCTVSVSMCAHIRVRHSVFSIEVLENLEIERLNYIRNALSKYSELSMTAAPVVQTVSVIYN